MVYAASVARLSSTVFYGKTTGYYALVCLMKLALCYALDYYAGKELLAGLVFYSVTDRFWF